MKVLSESRDCSVSGPWWRPRSPGWPERPRSCFHRSQRSHRLDRHLGTPPAQPCSSAPSRPTLNLSNYGVPPSLKASNTWAIKHSSSFEPQALGVLEFSVPKPIYTRQLSSNRLPSQISFPTCTALLKRLSSLDRDCLLTLQHHGLCLDLARSAMSP